MQELLERARFGPPLGLSALHGLDVAARASHGGDRVRSPAAPRQRIGHAQCFRNPRRATGCSGVS
eukprot:3160298-Alexandrium_andersonii.AAC.1